MISQRYTDAQLHAITQRAGAAREAGLNGLQAHTAAIDSLTEDPPPPEKGRQPVRVEYEPCGDSGLFVYYATCTQCEDGRFLATCAVCGGTGREYCNARCSICGGGGEVKARCSTCNATGEVEIMSDGTDP